MTRRWAGLFVALCLTMPGPARAAISLSDLAAHRLPDDNSVEFADICAGDLWLEMESARSDPKSQKFESLFFDSVMLWLTKAVQDHQMKNLDQYSKTSSYYVDLASQLGEGDRAFITGMCLGGPDMRGWEFQK
jgi:hypothetical protein